jgi:hypothetical protein
MFITTKPTTITRSQTKPKYIVEIDFDDASEAWKANKKYMGNGMYKYICLQKTKTGNACKNTALADSDFCKVHTQVSRK